MARPLRIQYPGAVYHVTVRGNERKAIFRDDADRRMFCTLLSRSLQIYSVTLHSYVLMDNHFHLLLDTPLGNLGEFMRQFNISYTGSFNRRHSRAGHLYQGRYKSLLVDKDAYLSVLSRYIHLNPIRTKAMAKRTDAEKKRFLLEYHWSSLPGYFEQGKKEQMVTYRFVLGEYGGESKEGRAAYR